jgi:hypothetical protein
MPEHKDDEIKSDDQPARESSADDDDDDDEEEEEREHPSATSSGQGAEPQIASVKEKIGEGRDNLQRRGGWFRRRTSGSEKS